MIVIQKGRLSMSARTMWENWTNKMLFYKGDFNNIFEVREHKGTITLVIPSGSRMMSSDIVGLKEEDMKEHLDVMDDIYQSTTAGETFVADYRLIDNKNKRVITLGDFGHTPFNCNGTVVYDPVDKVLFSLVVSDPATLMAKNIALTLPQQYDVAWARENFIKLVGAYYKYDRGSYPKNYTNLKSGRLGRVESAGDGECWISECIDGLIPYPNVRKVLLDQSYQTLVLKAVVSDGRLTIYPQMGAEGWLLSVFPQADFVLG